MNAPTAADLRRAMCCGSGPCKRPDACTANDPTWARTVHIPSAADAVARLMCERWRATAGDTMATQR
jgi:hypothetical protein